jgi:hypothetical protein
MPTYEDEKYLSKQERQYRDKGESLYGSGSLEALRKSEPIQIRTVEHDALGRSDEC